MGSTGAALPPFDWWRSSRVHFGSFDITEFPFCSLLFADLHPHLMDVPFFGLVIAMGVAYVVDGTDGIADANAGLFAGGIGLAVGLVRMVHTWDFPTAVAHRRRRHRRWAVAGERTVAGTVVAGRGAHGAVAAAVLVVPFSPYTAHFETFDPGLSGRRDDAGATSSSCSSGFL